MFKGYYFLGDGVKCDLDGYYWIIGRVDDVINVFGYCIGIVEVELVLVIYQECIEVVVVGIDYVIKGQLIYVFVTLREGCVFTEVTKKVLVNCVRIVIGLFVVFDII